MSKGGPLEKAQRELFDAALDAEALPDLPAICSLLNHGDKADLSTGLTGVYGTRQFFAEIRADSSHRAGIDLDFEETQLAGGRQISSGRGVPVNPRKPDQQRPAGHCEMA